MRILIINGSPKGKYSITLQTCNYLKKLHPQHEWDTLFAGQQIRSIEKELTEWMAGDKQTLCPTLQRIQAADLLLFSYPVYTCLVPAQLHRFIELLKLSGVDLRGHCATQLCTSRHFYDVTALRFMEDNAADLGLRMLDPLSADMEDLQKPVGQLQARQWWQLIEWKMAGMPAVLPSQKRVIIVADLAPDDEELAQKISSFRALLPYETELFNIRDFKFTSGCICCFNCSKGGKCSMPDGFDTYLREQIQLKHDSIVYAFRIKDHSMGSLFKLYDDRQFCNGHRTVTHGMPQAYIVAGDLSREENLRTLLISKGEIGGNYLAGIMTDQASLEVGAKQLVWALETRYTKPSTFYGVGGMKIFRDLIWHMRGLMRADHKYFREHELYDFPQKEWKSSLFTYLIGFMMSNKKVRRKLGNRINEGMIAPYQKVIDEARPE